MGQLETNGISWNANQPFYEHMKHQVWDKLSESDIKMNESEGILKLNSMENLYMVVIHWLDMIRFYIDVTELEELESIIKEIDTIAGGAEFSSAALSSEDNYKIKNKISKLRSKLWYLTAKNGMLPTKRDMTGEDVWF